MPSTSARSAETESAPHEPAPHEPGLREPAPLSAFAPKANKSRNRNKALFRTLRQGLMALALIAGAAFAAYSLRPSPVPADWAEVKLGPLSVVVEESGRTRFKDRYQVSAPVSGNLARLRFEPGDEVTEGQVLAELSPGISPLLDERSRRSAQARLAASLSALGQSKTQVQRAATAKQQAEQDLARTRELVANGALPPQAAEREQFAFELRTNELVSAQFTEKVAAEEVRGARAALGESTAHTSGRQIAVLAPASGVVLQVHSQSAGVVQAGAPLLEIGDPNTLEGAVDLLTTDAVQIQPNTPVEIVGWGEQRSVTGRVRHVEPAAFTRPSALGIEEQRVNVLVDLTAPRQQWSSLGHGFHIEARLITWQADKVLSVPSGALFRHGDGWAVFRVEADKAVLTQVVPGHRGTRDVEIVSGLDSGQRVLMHPSERVESGTRVQLRDRQGDSP